MTIPGPRSPSIRLSHALWFYQEILPREVEFLFHEPVPMLLFLSRGPWKWWGWAAEPGSRMLGTWTFCIVPEKQDFTTQGLQCSSFLGSMYVRIPEKKICHNQEGTTLEPLGSIPSTVELFRFKARHSGEDGLLVLN